MPRRRIVILSAAVLLAAGVAVFGRGTLAWWTRQMALRRLSIGALSTAEQWLAWSAWFDPADGRTDLLRAACLRRQYQQDAWNEAIQSAERRGAPAEWIRKERQLGRIQAGRMNDQQDELTALVEAGVSPHDVCAAFVHGYLARRDVPRAEMVLAAWAADHPQSAHVAYMRGVYWLWLGDGAGDLARRCECRARAEREFNNALAAEPRHEMARQALAEMLEEDDRIEEALAEYAALADRSPANHSARLGVSRMLRRLGALHQARLALESLGPKLEGSREAASEMGQIELESGSNAEAQEWLKRVDLERTADSDALRAAATMFSIQGETTASERLLARLDREHGLSVRVEDLRARLATGPLDPQAAEELRRLSSGSLPLLPGSSSQGTQPAIAASGAASQLYAKHCGGCHGDTGGGSGRGARHLYPRARDFRTERFRLVSTVNAVASTEDIASVIRQGMPGTSMRAYQELTDEQCALLAEEVLRLHREGVREQLAFMLRAQQEEIDQEELDEMVQSCTTPGDRVAVPPIGPGDAQAVARGKNSYFTLGCQNCHGEDGTGAWDAPCYDERGNPSTSRDLVHDPFKGGPEPESIYLRIFLGMPGTAHPACWNVPRHRLVDLVHYCRSLGREPKRVRTNHQRALAASRLPMKDEG